MATTKYDSLLPYVLSEVPGCSDPLAEQAIRDAAIEFCMRSRVWVAVADPLDVEPNQPEYDIDVPAGASIVQISSVKVVGQRLPLSARTVDWLDANLRDWRTCPGTPRFYTQIDDEAVIIAPVPDTAILNGLLLTAIVKPSRASTGFPSWINERYQDAIVAGAKGKLMQKQGTQWYNPAQGSAYLVQFDQGIGTAHGDVSTSLVRANLRTTSTH